MSHLSPTVGRPFQGQLFIAVLVVVVAFGALVWLVGASNPFTPAGYVGYLTKGAVLTQSRFVGTQRGPTSPGRGWVLAVTLVSITPESFREDFSHEGAVVSGVDW